ncbi:DUF2157 domain-containing protein [Kribbella sp. NPDC000426]|uniref:DUF2157 domain-containing protein n=1 Tax=Kribbella sp. NPDC000426 TaxID=3154255 RepID=UPI0033203E74
MRASTDDRSPVPELIDHWLGEGLITAEQAARMRAELDHAARLPAGPLPVEARRSRNPRQVASLVTEALAYLGGVIILVAVGLLVARHWQALGDGGQLGLLGGATAALLVAGLVVPVSRGPASYRLRSVLWVLSSAAAAAFFALFADRVLHLDGEAATLVAASAVTALAAALWWRLRALPQQVVFFVASMVAGAAAVAEFTDEPRLPGLAVWGIGVAWFVLGLRGTLPPRRPVLALAACAALVGAVMTMPADAGLVLALCTVVAIVVVAVLVRDLLLLAVGAVGALNILPAVVTHWFPGDLAAPLVLLVVGGLLVASAVYTATARRKP